MNLESTVQRIRDAFDMLNRRDPGMRKNEPPPTPRTRTESTAAQAVDAPELGKAGFADEALPWMDAVHRFALRLTNGDTDQAADLVQDTFLKAYRSWHRFEQGTNCRSWLFTICKNTHLRILDEARTRREVTQADLEADVEAMGVLEVHEHARSHGAGCDTASARRVAEPDLRLAPRGDRAGLMWTPASAGVTCLVTVGPRRPGVSGSRAGQVEQ